MTRILSRRDFNRTLAAGVGAAASSLHVSRLAAAGPGQSAQFASLRVDGARLNRHLTDLRRFGGTPDGGTSRLAYTDADLQAREYVQRLMRDAKLEIRVDTAGNIIGRRAGTAAGLKPIAFGSHVDSVPGGGNYDGQVGSMGAIEVAQVLAERGPALRHPIEVIIFQNEEGGTVGSRAIAGHLADKDLDVVSRSGKTLRDGTAFIGGHPDRIGEASRPKGDCAAFIELHIEQGITLDERHIDIGVVLGIVGIGWWDVTIDGVPNHAGTTAMNRRQDALLSAARYIEMVNRVITSEPGGQVGTVGRIQALPGAPNVIPGQVLCSLEIRDLDGAKIQRLFERVRDEANRIGAMNGTRFTFTETYRSTPALTDPAIRSVIERSSRGLGLSTLDMPSGAGHDAQYMAELCPTGMIFVPSAGGVSHSPKEYSSPEAITNGANVLLQTVLALDA
jgi:N-carbamoyl-L-amino-acid hydrolase